MKLKIFIATILAVALAGCGEGEATYETQQAESVSSSGWLNHNLKLVRITVDGTELLCLERQGKSGEYSSGQYAGLTCDWFGWHAKRGDYGIGQEERFP